ncbi:universal stress protein [Algoriphagus machipongonensis]|uniref:Universal stress protein n=1 Tax=Algoriphagus machipongonensis TaxID=388413 RepID=A3I328_9BACT|nr:universal stress protein [Algoriphagus machipongonensis]EAZ79227.1 putative universal stress protein [Algoriphagus machipongonensis]
MKILIPMDFSENSRKTLEFAISLSRTKATTITLIHVIEVIYDFAAQSAIAIEGMHRDADQYFQKFISTFKEPGIKLEYILKEGTVSIMTAKIAEELSVDLIIMGTHGASGVERSMMGTNAVEVIKSSEVPVLLFPEKAQISGIQKMSLAIELNDHEEPFINNIIQLSKTWNLKLDLIHVQQNRSFTEELALLGLERFLEINHPELEPKVNTIKAEKVEEGIGSFLKENPNTILVMCHRHHSFWEQIMSKSKSIEIAYHPSVPLLVMI